MQTKVNVKESIGYSEFPIEYKKAVVDGINIFYREAGPPDAPLILLLHGFPSSSRMFMNLMPLLLQDYHMIAPDYPGFGYSDSPSPLEFSYTFDHLADCIKGFIREINADKYTLYLQDYGGPVGFRIAAANPERIEGLIIQNAVSHPEGLSEVWDIRRKFWSDRIPYEEKIRESLLSEKTAKQRHLGGARHPERINPDTWSDEFIFLNSPGMADIQIELAFDYRTNAEAYTSWQYYMAANRPPALIVWGKYDPFFTVAGALAYNRELPDAEIYLLNAGHFALDEEAEFISLLIERFMQKEVRREVLEI